MIIEHGVAKPRTLDHNPALEKLAGISRLLGCVVEGAGFLLTREEPAGVTPSASPCSCRLINDSGSTAFCGILPGYG